MEARERSVASSEAKQRPEEPLALPDECLRVHSVKQPNILIEQRTGRSLSHERLRYRRLACEW